LSREACLREAFGVAKNGALLTVLGMLLLLFCASRLFCGLNQPEAMDQAQVARNLARGDGYTTLFIRPLSLWLTGRRAPAGASRLDAHPDLANPPLHPALMAGLFYVLEKGDTRAMAPRGMASNPVVPAAARPLGAVVLSWRGWVWVWIGLAAVWFLGAWVRYVFGRLQPREVGWHTTGIAGCLLLAGLAYAPRVSFGIESAGRFRWFAPELWIVCGLGVPLTLLNGWLVYFTGRRLFDRRAGAVAACVFVLSDTVCQYALSGLSVPLATTWTLWAWLALVAADQRQERGGGPAGAVALRLAAAALLGLAFLTKYSAGWLLLPACLLVGRRRGGWGGAALAAAMAGVFALVAGPWLARNDALSGHLLGLAHYAPLVQTGAFPGHVLERTLQPGDLTVRAGAVAAKAVRAAPALWSGGGWLAGAFVPWALFLVVMVHRFRSARANAWKGFTAGAAALLFAVACVVGMEDDVRASPALSGNLTVLVLPLVCVFSAAWFQVWLDGLSGVPKLLRKLMVAGFVTAAALPLLLRLAGAPAGRMAYPPYHPPALQRLAGCVEPSEWMVSDLPWAVAWYGNRTCLWLPRTPEQFYEASERHQRVVAMLLTPLTLNARFITEIRGAEWAQRKGTYSRGVGGACQAKSRGVFEVFRAWNL